MNGISAKLTFSEKLLKDSVTEAEKKEGKLSLKFMFDTEKVTNLINSHLKSSDIMTFGILDILLKRTE